MPFLTSGRFFSFSEKNKKARSRTMTSLRSISSYSGSMQSSEGQEVKKYILVRDTVAKSRWPHGVSAKSRILSKRSEQRVLKGSLWQEMEESFLHSSLPPSTSRSLSRSGSSMTTSPGAPPFKQCVESIEIEDLTLQCAAGFLSEITDEICRMLLAIPTSEERYYVYSDTDRMKHAQFINVGSDVIVNKRNIPPCRAAVRWKGRLAGKQGLWFGVEIVVSRLCLVDGSCLQGSVNDTLSDGYIC